LIKEINPDDYQALIIPGGFNDAGYTEVYNQKVLDLIRKIYESGGIIATMCIGSLAVARTGILKGKKATTYSASNRHDNLAILRDFGAIPVKERIIVTDRIITNRGPDTAIEVAFKLLEMLSGKKDMKKIKKAMMFE
jgi:4-methyl-5(b-hydroxyethyl)-thiazole monophosphate biosynthesis